MKPLKWVGTFLLLLLIYPVSKAVPWSAGGLPEDRGTAGTLAALKKLPVYVRVLQIVAHPDDESAGTLTWLSRNYHATTALFSLTRGEGGQNILGKDKYEALGLVRTGELLEACRFYGIDLFFGNNLDFGFSKTADETFTKWGHEAALEEMVRFIRTWRPSIILSRFSGNPMDGHGHHQASGEIVREAYRAASTAAFPKHFGDGLRPWWTNSLYLSSRNMGEASGTPVVRIPVGDYDPVLGRSYREIASEGYSKHRTQGMGARFSLPGQAYEYFELAESSVPTGNGENSFFDARDTSLLAIHRLVGDEEDAIPFLRQDLTDAMQSAEAALRAFQAEQPEKSGVAVAEGIRILMNTLHRVEAASISVSLKKQLKEALQGKITDFQEAVSAVLGIKLIARSENGSGVPGEKSEVILHFHNQGNETVDLALVKITAPGTVIPSETNPPMEKQSPESTSTFRFTVEIPENADVTEPFWYLEDIRNARYKIRSMEDEFLPFGKPVLRAQAVYRFRGAEITVREPVKAQVGDPVRGPELQDFQIVPALSVTLDPDSLIAPITQTAGSHQFQVSIKNNRALPSEGRVKIISHQNWPVIPGEVPFSITHKGEAYTANITIQIPAGTEPGNYVIEAVATMEGRNYKRRQQIISYPGNWTRNLYSPSQSEIKAFDIATAPDLTIGYITGAGDDIPTALQRLGVQVEILTTEDLASGDLSRFSAIVTGIRAYNVNEDLQSNNRRLLEYVSSGGVMIVQYVRPTVVPTSPFRFGPYPMSVTSSDRITVENSPISILAPGHRIFTRPNRITEADFEGWVQERGLYFMNSWDKRYTPLLSGNDPGESAKDGGMLLAQYGEGYYIYSAYSWFRQLPAGVPGAFRIFANMISLGYSENQE